MMTGLCKTSTIKKMVDADGKLVDLLATMDPATRKKTFLKQLHNNIAKTPQKSAQTKTQQKLQKETMMHDKAGVSNTTQAGQKKKSGKPLQIPEVFNIPDTKLRLQPYAME